MHELQDLLKQLRSNPSNKEIKKKVSEWLINNSKNEQTDKLLEEHWNLLDSDLPENEITRLDTLLSLIHKKGKIDSSTQTENRRTNTIKAYKLLKIAAVFLLPLALYFSFRYLTDSENKTLSGQLLVQQTDTEPTHFYLPDSTQVWLNSKSQLRYPKNFDRARKRTVSLTGQAFFKVYHDEAHPFIVQTSEIDIRVLGTSFDVSAYPDEQKTASTLEEGSIAVLDKKGRRIEKLVPGEQVIFSTIDKKIDKRKVKTKDYTSWIKGKLIFKDSEIGEVVKKLERRYDCVFTVSPELLKENPTYTFSIQDESLEEICLLIELSTNAKAIINGSHIQLSKN